MFNKNKYYKTTLGQFAEVLVGAAVAYSDDATYAAFVANAVEGEIAIVNADTMAIPASGGGALAAGTRIFFALKRNGLVETTNPIVLGQMTAKRVAPVAGVAQVSTATIAGTPVAGKAYGIRIMETTPLVQPFPLWYYETIGRTGDTITTIAGRLRDLINDANSATNKNTDTIVTATAAAGVITITGKSVGLSFRVSFSADLLNDLAAVAAQTANPTFGNGTGDQVAELELQATVFKGITHTYPGSGVIPSEFGMPTQFANTALQYMLYTYVGFKSETSPTPVNMHHHKAHVLIAVPSAGGPAAAMTTILGL